jgi:cell fate regulator YaaT (PSP1 superfamily)
MPLVIGVTFKPVTKVYFFDPAEFTDLQVGDYVVVDTSRGRTLGRVTAAPHEADEAEINPPLKPVLRRATAWDLVQQDQMAHREAETLAICRERAEALRLDMKVVRVEYSFDGASLLVYFTAEQRVDFRTLVHDLAQALRTRVEMRQIGVRDEAKLQGGYGRCGLSLCCASWLREFTPVSIKMAKQQDLPLNPAEISGVCGRLLCCLSYEDDYYAEARRYLPRLNSTIDTPEGPGKVRQVHVLRNTVTAQVQGPNDTKMFIEVPVPEINFDAPPGATPCPACPKAATAALAAADEDVFDEADLPDEAGLSDEGAAWDAVEVGQEELSDLADKEAGEARGGSGSSHGRSGGEGQSGSKRHARPHRRSH